MNIEQLKKLPDSEKAKIAHILLNSERTGIGADELSQMPVLTLLKHSTASNLAVEFLRVSSEEQRTDGFSLPAQKEKSDAYVKEYKLNCVKGWSVAESASKELDRKEFFDMLRYVSENGIKNVIFDKIDRACRGLRAAVFIEDLVEAGVRFHFTRDGLIVDKNSPPGDKLRFYLGVVLAKYYIDNLKTEIRKGMDHRWENGYWNGAAPVGYRNIRDDSGRAWIEIDRVVAPFIKEVFELYATGNYSYKALEKHLEGKVFLEREIREEKNGELFVTVEKRPISYKCIESLIPNPFYYGARRRLGKVVMTGKEKHVPLITKELFDACQKIKAIRAKNSKKSLALEIQKPYMNLLICGDCAHAVTGEAHKKASGKIYVYYHCANQACAQRRINVRQEAISEQLRAAFAPFAKLTPKAVNAFLEGIKGQLDQIQVYSNEEIDRLRAKKSSIESRCVVLGDLLKNGKLSETEYNDLALQKNKLLHEIEIGIEGNITASQQTFIAGLGVIELLGKSSAFMELDGFELDKARLVKLVLSNSTLENGKLRYDYKKPFDDLIELTRHRNWWT